ncbi:MAG: NAD-dependent protein deacylase [bacterium]|nr:MAG: NAD-dependent protein deacylase [bacterium]
MRSAKRVTVLTGAGVSAESGVPTFRGEEGLWRNFRAEELATPEAFYNDPKLVWEWYGWRRKLIAPLKPNPGHSALVDMEKKYQRFVLITQNVDGLHAKAGSKNILELHGNIWHTRCTVEGMVKENLETELKEIPPLCECGAMLRPHIVWFGESLEPEILKGAMDACRNCDVMIVAGTSAVVQPAASMAGIASDAGAFIIEVNPDRTLITGEVDAHLHGKSGDVLPLLLNA